MPSLMRCCTFVLVMIGGAVAAWGQVAGPQPASTTGPTQAPTVPQVANLPSVSGQPAPPQQPGQPLSAGQQPPPVQAPFLLTPQQEQFLDQVLGIWERESDKIQLFKSEFKLFEYDATLLDPQVPTKFCYGEVRYSKPDKGYYEIKTIHVAQPNPDPAKQQAANVNERFVFPLSQEQGEKWICDGQAIFEFAASKKQVIERRLPPEMLGKAISDGPLPFVFGVEAAKLKKRYWLRIITPPNEQTNTWIEAYPKFRADAANYQRIEIVLRNQDLMPQAVQVFMPNNLPDKKVSKVYVFDNPQANGVLATIGNFMGMFVRPQLPLGWQWEVENPGQGQNPPGVPGQPQVAPAEAKQPAGFLPRIFGQRK